MAKKKIVSEVEAEVQISNKLSLKDVAKLYKTSLNQSYRESIAYTPDIDEIPKVTVNKWLEMPVLGEVLEMPGLPFGNITHIYGKPDCGKTTALMDGIIAAQEQGILPILILTEHKFDFNRIAKFMGGDPESLLVIHADNIEKGYSIMEKLLKDLANKCITLEAENGSQQSIDMTKQDCFIFFDSVGNTLSESELAYEVEDWNKNMGKAAKALRVLTKRVNLLLSRVRDKCGILLLNQSYMSMPSYGPSIETPYGGDGIPYSCALNIRLRRIRSIEIESKKKKKVIGLETLIEVKKNHITHLQCKGSVYTVACGMIPCTKEDLEEFKKAYIR